MAELENNNSNFILTTNLSLEIEKCNNKFQKWCENRVHNLQVQQSTFSTQMDELESSTKTLYDTNSQLEASRNINNAIKEQQQREIDNAQFVSSQNKMQLQSMSSYLRELDHFEQQTNENQKLIRQKHDMLKQAMEQKLQDFAHGTNFYKMLGLEFLKTTGDCMRFSFTQIDAKDPLRAFFFVIFVDENSVYQLVETSPHLDESKTKELLKNLNETNNISGFVIQMRKCFVEYSK
jgi:hypothetical protein